MDVLLRTGFERITHKINFQPATEPKGIKLFKANHIRSVQEYRHNGESLFIQAEVVRQAAVSSEPYKVQLNIDNARVVTSVSCTCVYNQSGRCKHVAALIYYVNNYESLSKTNFEQQWGRPTPKQFAKEKYSKGSNFIDMFTSMPLLKMELSLPAPDELDFESSLKIMLSAEASIDRTTAEIASSMSSLLDLVEKNLREEDCEICLLNIHNFIEEYAVYTANHALCDSIKLFFKTHIELSSEEIITLCTETVDQAMCVKWQSARSWRFSASSTIHKIKIRKSKTIHSLLSELIFPNKVNTSSMQYGKDNESEARKLYERMSRKQVEEVGVIVSKYQPWLCASPDGVVIENECIVGLVEIKCPSSCQKLPIADFKNRKCNVNYLKFIGDEIMLKESHMYYTQCQVQMYLCGLNVCDLFVYTPLEDGSCLTPVYRDELFIESVILKSEDFYFKYFLPTLYSKITEENERMNIGQIKEQPSRVFSGKNIQNTI